MVKEDKMIGDHTMIEDATKGMTKSMWLSATSVTFTNEVIVSLTTLMRLVITIDAQSTRSATIIST